MCDLHLDFTSAGGEAAGVAAAPWRTVVALRLTAAAIVRQQFTLRGPSVAN